MRTYVRMPAEGSHLPYPRFTAALQARDLAFIQRHAERLTLGLCDAAAVCELIAEQAPAQLEAAAVRWVRRYAAEARGQRWGDYGLIVAAFDALGAASARRADGTRAPRGRAGNAGGNRGGPHAGAGAGAGERGRAEAARRLRALCAKRGV